MKLVYLATCYVFIFCFHLHAQSKRWTVKAGEEAKNALPASFKFRYPEFTAGTVHFKGGAISDGLLDFNFLNQEMQFIDPKGDTLSIDSEATINYISINSDTFYYSKGYVEYVSGNSIAKIAKRERLKIGDIAKMGGYDQPSSISAITSVTSLSNSFRVADLTQRVDLSLVKETTFYIGDQYNHFLPANKKNIMKMFRRKETELGEFFKENSVRFNNQNDLKRIIDFLQKTL